MSRDDAQDENILRLARSVKYLSWAVICCVIAQGCVTVRLSSGDSDDLSLRPEDC